MIAGSVIIVVGPTACGKSAVSMELAKELGGEIICADSMQVYRGLDIGTAKPSASDREMVPHHCLDIADPHRGDFSVETWLGSAQTAIAEIHRRGKCPIVVGGTNLYIKVLSEGLFRGPPANPELRAELASMTREDLLVRLNKCDPASAARLHINDVRRVTRAIEVAESSGSTISSQQTQWDEIGLRLPEHWRVLGLECESAVNSSLTNARVYAMMDAGFLDEVSSLRRQGPLGLQASEAIGYKELTAHLDGKTTLNAAIEATKARTRQLARRQRTWLRRFSLAPNSRWFHSPTDPFECARAFLMGSETSIRSVEGEKPNAS